MQKQELRAFTEAEHQTWQEMFARLEPCRQHQADPLFAAGIRKLGLSGDRIPDLQIINRRLLALTGWQGIPVVGLEDGPEFFAALAQRQFPIGNFIRDAADLNYTPAPDIFHDLYGHIPFFADRDYADFNYEFGRRAMKYADNKDALNKFGRLYWFGLEFPLVKTPAGNRIFGGGILSSFGESNYSLSSEPQVLPFDVVTICHTDYRIDEFQHKIFILESPQQLYQCLDDFEAALLQSYH